MLLRLKLKCQNIKIIIMRSLNSSYLKIKLDFKQNDSK